MANKKVKTNDSVSDFQAQNASNSSNALPFGKSNYTFMLIGIATILVGFLIMTMDKEEFGFGFLGITLGPIIVFLGFMIELYAILRKKS
ncbi:Protein of unknown function [Spirosomataceae bacterium TFI 002]|nr:Protein of unknown function [Spirosomataceae bacterium TFI 002]